MKTNQLEPGAVALADGAGSVSALRAISLGVAIFLTTGTAYGQDELQAVEPSGQAAAAAGTDESVTELEAFTVKGRKITPADAAKLKLDSVAGGTGLVKAEEVERGRATTAEDILKFQPGVIAQSGGGTSAIKISIRGSGANASPGYFREGTKFLFDGIALTGPGGTPNELLETAGLDYTEVLRGANAFDYGALSLGGAINFVSKTGRTAPGVEARLDVGSFGFHKATLSAGGQVGDGDYYVAVSNLQRDGFQDWTNVENTSLVSNFGYRINDKLETRFFVRAADYFHESAGGITLRQIKQDATKNNLANVNGKASYGKNASYWVGNKTTYTFDDSSRLEFGIAYHNYPQTISKAAPSANDRSDWDFRDINTTLRYLRSDEIFGHKSDTTLSFSSTYSILGGYKTYQGQTRKLRKLGDFGGGYDAVFSAGNEFGLTDDLWLSTGLSLSKVHREFHIPFSDRANTTPYPQNDSYTEWSLAPRVGLRYAINPGVQVFTNASRSIDPPSSWSYAPSGATTNYVKPLRNQVADTIEVGLRGKSGIFDGSLALYRSWIQKELLNVEIVPAVGLTPAVTSTFNSSGTIHQGIEAGLDTQLWKGVSDDKLVLRQVYTLNDFYYRGDKRFSSNKLPGLPDHVYRAELQYQDHGGFYAGVDVSLVSSAYADYANSFKAPGYAIYGAKAGYEAPSKKWKVYLDLKNLTDKEYVTATGPVYNAAGRDVAAFYPGDGFGAFAGATIKF